MGRDPRVLTYNWTSAPLVVRVADGRQFIVVAIGDGHTRGRLVALALRRPGS